MIFLFFLGGKYLLALIDFKWAGQKVRRSSSEFFVCLFVFNGPPLSKHPLWALYQIVKINSTDLGNIWCISLVLTCVLEK